MFCSLDGLKHAWTTEIHKKTSPSPPTVIKNKTSYKDSDKKKNTFSNQIITRIESIKTETQMHLTQCKTEINKLSWQFWQ